MQLFSALTGYHFFTQLLSSTTRPEGGLAVTGASHLPDAFLGQAPNAEFAAPVQAAFDRITDGLTADNLQDRVRRERDRFGDDIKDALLKISTHRVKMPKKIPKVKGSAYGDPLLGVAPDGSFLLFAPFTKRGRGGWVFSVPNLLTRLKAVSLTPLGVMSMKEKKVNWNLHRVYGANGMKAVDLHLTMHIQ